MSELIPVIATSLLEAHQARSRAKEANAAAQAQADSQVRQIREGQAIEERRRQEQLIRNLAAQRARAGATGVAGAGGSSEALLQGLSNESGRDISDTRRLNLLRTDDIYSNLAYTRRRNLLEARNSMLGSLLNLSKAGFSVYKRTTKPKQIPGG